MGRGWGGTCLASVAPRSTLPEDAGCQTVAGVGSGCDLSGGNPLQW
jgi:hypothetical protein